MYTESVTSSITKLYISETQNKHAGPYTCVALDQPGRRVAERRVTLLLYSKNAHTSPPGHSLAHIHPGQFP